MREVSRDEKQARTGWPDVSRLFHQAQQPPHLPRPLIDGAHRFLRVQTITACTPANVAIQGSLVRIYLNLPVGKDRKGFLVPF